MSKALQVAKVDVSVRQLYAGLAALCLSGCAVTPATPKVLQPPANWQSRVIVTDGLPVRVWQRPVAGDSIIHVYIEGDGRAYIRRNQPSANPTPRAPVALQLAEGDAARQSAATVIYMARPCQYMETRLYPACRPAVWTRQRFAAAPVRAMRQVLRETLPQSAGLQPTILIGYSGGAAIALALAEGDASVRGVMTIAGNLAPDAVNAWHRVSRNPEDINPLKGKGLAALPMLVASGEKDRIIPPELTTHMLTGRRDWPCLRTVTVPGADHHDGWTAWWRDHGLPLLDSLLAPAGGACYKP